MLGTSTEDSKNLHPSPKMLRNMIHRIIMQNANVEERIGQEIGMVGGTLMYMQRILRDIHYIRSTRDHNSLH